MMSASDWNSHLNNLQVSAKTMNQSYFQAPVPFERFNKAEQCALAPGECMQMITEGVLAKVLAGVVLAHIDLEQKERDEHVLLLTAAHRCCRHESKGFSPITLKFCRGVFFAC